MDYNACVDILTSSATRALRSVIAKFKTFKDVCFDTFNKLYHSMVVPITDYCSSVWVRGFSPKQLVFRIEHFAIFRRAQQSSISRSSRRSELDSTKV